ncbi:MAG: ImmA/IrrE family metallo-endopeptidase [Bacteroidetes bacterium]|nr:ImmA/IrrE family metallo-endopeptidase [Bacteroidota bacterium]
MEIELPPETKIAIRFYNNNNLKIPFNILDLVKKHATVYIEEIPIDGIDGVAINLKQPLKKPKIIINKSISSKRLNFTLAHELGHVIIPWHIGTIIEDSNLDYSIDSSYSKIEQEANRFAAELLMPRNWISETYDKCKNNLAYLQEKIIDQCDVSCQAAALRMIELLPRNIFFIAESDDQVYSTGKTKQTNISLPKKGDWFEINKVLYNNLYYKHISYNNIIYHWFKINPVSISNFDITDNRTSKDILERIEFDIAPNQTNFKQSINGVIGHLNGKLMLEPDYSCELLISELIHRFRVPDHESFSNHRDFEVYIHKRAQEIFKKRLR